MAIRRKDVEDLRAQLSSVMGIFTSAHKHAAQYQLNHPGVYAEVFGEINLHEPLTELKLIDSTLQGWARKLSEEKGG